MIQIVGYADAELERLDNALREHEQIHAGNPQPFCEAFGCQNVRPLVDELMRLKREERAYHVLRKDVGELLRRLPVDLPAPASNMRLAVVADLSPRA